MVLVDSMENGDSERKVLMERRTPSDRKVYFLLYLIYRSGKISQDSLLEILGVTKRVLKKYKNELNKVLEEFSKNELGYEDSYLEIVDEKSDGKSYFFLSGFHEGNLDENIQKVISAFSAKNFLESLNITYIKENIKEIFDKLIASLKYKSYYKTFLNNLDRIFCYHPYAPKDYKAREDIVNTILNAIVNQKVLKCQYSPLIESGNKSKNDFLLKPYSIVFHLNALYLIGEDEHHKIKTYAVDRFVCVRMTSEKFHYPEVAKYNPKNYLNDFIGIIGDGERATYELIFSDNKPLQKSLMERRWFANQSFEKLSDGRLKMCFTTCNSIEVQRWIQSFGEDVEVIRPKQKES